MPGFGVCCGHWGIAVLILAKITRASAGGYAEYLEGKTRSAALGDYYLKDGERTEAPGRWVQGATQFGVDPEQPVTAEQLHMLMDVRRPDTGEELRRAGGSGEAVSAIDATFSAPKSVSAVWALADRHLRADIERAHEAAIDRALHHAIRLVPMLRRRVSQDTVLHEKASGLISTSWRHTTARHGRWAGPGPAAAFSCSVARRCPPRWAGRRDRLPSVAGAPARDRRRVPHRTRTRARPPWLPGAARHGARRAVLRAGRDPPTSVGSLVKPSPPSPRRPSAKGSLTKSESSRPRSPREARRRPRPPSRSNCFARRGSCPRHRNGSWGR